MPEDPTLREFEQASAGWADRASSAQGAERHGIRRVRQHAAACKQQCSQPCCSSVAQLEAARLAVQCAACPDAPTHPPPTHSPAPGRLQARALQDMLEKPQPLSPAGGGATAAAASGAASPRLPGAAEPAEAAGPSGGQPAGGGGGASAPATPSITSGGGAQSPRGGSSSGAEAPVSPRPGVGPAELVLDPAAGPPIWKARGGGGGAGGQIPLHARKPSSCPCPPCRASHPAGPPAATGAAP